MNLLDRHYLLLKLLAEYCPVPLHLLSLIHQYELAAVAGALVVGTYAIAAVRHERQAQNV
jgi:hypothetical protein